MSRSDSVETDDGVTTAQRPDDSGGYDPCLCVSGTYSRDNIPSKVSHAQAFISQTSFFSCLKKGLSNRQH